LFSPCAEKIFEIGIPNFDITISSVSSRGKPVRRCKQSPTVDLPAPIMPMSTIDLTGEFISGISQPGISPKYLINTLL
jgi:hypothetical protein